MLEKHKVRWHREEIRPYALIFKMGSRGRILNIIIMKAESAIICDYAGISPDGKATINGIFSRIECVSFPATSTFYLYCRFFDQKPNDLVIVYVVFPNGTREEIFKKNVPTDIATSDAIDFILKVDNLKLNEAGSHQIQIDVNSDPVATAHFVVA